MNPVLKIDPEFEAMCPPLTDEEYEQLEENILDEGLVLTPLIVWDDTIIDGHNRYKIVRAYPNITFSIYEKPFDNRYAALAWICKNQLGRRNLTPQQKKYLIGQRYEAEKEAESFHGNRYTSSSESSADQFGQHKKSKTTRKKIADETHTSEGYVQRAEYYAKGVNAADEVLPGIKAELLSGTIKPTETAVAAVAKAPPEERRQKAEALRVRPDKPPKDGYKPRAGPSPVMPMKEKRQELKEVRDVCAGMADNTAAPTGDDSAMETLHGTITDMIRVCDTLFIDFPRLLTESANKVKVVEIMQEAKAYIIKIERGDTK